VSLPGFGVFRDGRVLGALTLGVGPMNAHSLVKGAAPDDCLTDDTPSCNFASIPTIGPRPGHILTWLR
jgi:hypothetical protein